MSLQPGSWSGCNHQPQHTHKCRALGGILSHGKQVLAHGKQALVHGRRALVHGRQVLVHDTQVLVHGTPALVHGRQVLGSSINTEKNLIKDISQ